MDNLSQERYNELTNIELKYNLLKEENEELKFNLDGMTCDRDAKEEEIDKLMDSQIELKEEINGDGFLKQGYKNELSNSHKQQNRMVKEIVKLKEQNKYLDEENKKLKEDNKEINKINRQMITLKTLMETMEKNQQEWADYCEKLQQENNELELKVKELKDKKDRAMDLMKQSDKENDELKEENKELKEFRETAEETCTADATIQSILNKLEKAKNQIYEKELAIKKYVKNKKLNNKNKDKQFEEVWDAYESLIEELDSDNIHDALEKINTFKRNHNLIIEELNMNYNDDTEEYDIDIQDIITEIEELKGYKNDAEELMDYLEAEDLQDAVSIIDDLRGE